jgi:hypothetical protein
MSARHRVLHQVIHLAGKLRKVTVPSRMFRQTHEDDG